MQFLSGGMTPYGVADLEKEFNIKFAGRGFYFTKTGVILVLPRPSNVETAVENDSAEQTRGTARHQDGADLLAFLALDFDFAEPTNPDEFGKASRVVLVALVHAD